MRIYLDTCVLNRLSDDKEQARVKQEAAAVEDIFRLIMLGTASWVASSALAFEIGHNPDTDKRNDVLALLEYAGPLLRATNAVRNRARELHALGYGILDAAHVAFAEHAGVDALLTTDDRLVRRAARGLGRLQVRVANPVDWLHEVTHGAG